MTVTATLPAINVLHGRLRDALNGLPCVDEFLARATSWADRQMTGRDFAACAEAAVAAWAPDAPRTSVDPLMKRIVHEVLVDEPEARRSAIALVQTITEEHADPAQI